ncbi:sushi domain-containing protein 4 isoform X1 [Tachysurus fulvidraco]|uniref:sushi domain-containing protein 4 isoform X1 n=1 Tax=Tachysurus fulvidraco TaxID=1234273 RepID=UPI000F4EA846|nr:sushi domain-containing protein 4 isoform X1 [Tachysurus fulvidraco]XP_027028459.1 sushi domain-containing protein 4 isoform X1 [Tachysurus fulvidraco]XP_047677371.1 sushi domain-containing protein 4 isoform X1 [Tachysurus fulvidraco]
MKVDRKTSPFVRIAFTGQFLVIFSIFPLQLVTAFPQASIAEQFCRDPGVPEHGSRTPSSGVFFENAMARFSCLGGYRLKGVSKITCVLFHNGSMGWRPSLKPVCLPEECLPPYIEDAVVANKTYRPGDNLIIRCYEGFQIRYPDTESMESVCQEDGTWDNQPICQGCLRPLIPPHSYMNISETQFSMPIGTVVHYQCFPGYKLEGAELLECMYSLIWSDVPPRCLDVEACPLPPMVEHGDYICHPQPCNRYIHGTVVEFYCDPGYSLMNDYKYITCQYGQWFPQMHIYCVQDETSWPGFQESLLHAWKPVAFTTSSVLLALFLVIIAKMSHCKCKSNQNSSEEQEDARGPNVIIVDGVAIPLPSYEEAVRGSCYQPPHVLPSSDPEPTQNSVEHDPPSYPGPTESQHDAPLDTGDSETCDSISEPSECLQAMHPSSSHDVGLSNVSEKTNAITSMEETASTSPSIDIADEIPLVDGGEEDF